MSILLTLIYKYGTSPVKIPASSLVDIDKIFLKFIEKGKRHRIVNTILKKRINLEDSHYQISRHSVKVQ